MIYTRVSPELKVRLALMRLFPETMRWIRRCLARDTVRELLARSFSAVRSGVTNATDADFEQPTFFFREQTTVRRGYLRALVHMHEHMGQLTGYIRMLGMPAPWLDWRPDRR